MKDLILKIELLLYRKLVLTRGEKNVAQTRNNKYVARTRSKKNVAQTRNIKYVARTRSEKNVA